MHVGEGVHAPDAGGLDDFGIGRGRVSEEDVFPQGAEKEHRVLGDRADAPPEFRGVQLADVDAVDEDRSPLGAVKPQQEFSEGGLPRADAADQGDFFTFFDAERDARKGGPFLPRVGEGDVAELDRASQASPAEPGGAGRPFGRLVHDVVQGGQGPRGRMVLHQEGGDLRDGRHGPRREQVGGDEASHADPVLHDEVDSQDHRGDRNGELHPLHPVDDPRGKQPEPHVRSLEEGDGLFPAALDLPLRTLGLEGFHGDEAFHQRGVFHRAGPVRRFRQVAHPSLDQRGVKEDQGDPQDQGQGERPRNQGDDREEEDGEGEVDIGEDGGGGDEVPDRLEALDAVGERTRGRGPFLRPHPQDLFHHFAGEADVGPDGCQVDEVSPRHVQGEVGRDDH